MSELIEFGRLGDATTMARQSGTEHVRHEHDVVLDTDRTLDDRLVAEVTCCAQEFGVSVAHLIATQSTAPVLVDQCASREAMVDDAAQLVSVVVGQRQRAQPSLAPSHEPTR